MTHGLRYIAEHKALAAVPHGFAGEVSFDAGANVFVCGALQDPVKMRSLIDRDAPFAFAAVCGYTRATETIGGTPVDFLVAEETPSGNALTGVVWIGLSDAEIAAVESLELDGGHRRRVDVGVRCGLLDLTAVTYVRR